MIRQLLNIRLLFALIAIAIISGSIIYAQFLAKKIEQEEKEKVEMWVEALKSYLNPNNTDIELSTKVMGFNDDIPIIETNEKDSITNSINLDTARQAKDPNFLPRQLQNLKASGKPLIYKDPLNPQGYNKYYYGHTTLLNQVRYYPIVQLIIIILFLIITFWSIQSNYRSKQNQLWTGMAKETAHQLGTPISSLEGWLEMLKDNTPADTILPELEKDIGRLRLVSDRFSKIGSIPKLEHKDIIVQIKQVVDYIKKRASGRVNISVAHQDITDAKCAISPPLFDWVVENLLKNALDAMDGNGGSIDLIISQKDTKKIVIDVKDTGKGISGANINKVFNPGFTTKKRGWGLGLSLSKRIIEQYHNGEIFVKHSEPNRGTTFRIVLDLAK